MNILLLTEALWIVIIYTIAIALKREYLIVKEILRLQKR